jgi:hypothetical protein
MIINNLFSTKEAVDRILSTEEQQSNEIRGCEQGFDKLTRPSARFEALQRELLRLRPDLTRESIDSLILQKKSKVGGGFLTDQGALFLVASDLGVALKPMLSEKIRLSDLQPETNELVIDARILTIGPPKIFQRKADSTPGFVMKIVLYDLSSSVSMNIWNNEIASNLIRSTLRPGDGIKIQLAYTRKGMDNTGLTLSISDRGQITRADENELQISQIPRIRDRSIELSQLKTAAQGTNLVIRANISSAIRTGEFKRKDGTESRYVTFSLNDSDHVSRGNDLETRVVLWNNSNPIFEKLRMGESITLLNVRLKISEYFGSKTLELHGDESSGILEHWDESKVWLEGRFALVSKQVSKSSSLPTEDAKLQKTSGFIARVLSIGQNFAEEDTSTSSHLLIIDSLKRRISVRALDEALEEARALKVDDVLICKPNTFDQIGLKAVCTKRGSLSKVRPERNDIPRSTVLVSEIARLEPNSLATIDCMVLSMSPSRDVQTKEGPVKRSEALLADPSGEIRLYAWRGLSKHLEKLSAGVRLWLHATEVQSHEGKKFLVFKNYSQIEIQG